MPLFVLSLCLGALPGCYVLERHDSSLEQNIPPAIRSPEGAVHPLDQLVRLEPLDPGDENTEEVFEFVVFEPNVGQTLEYRVFLDRVPGFDVQALVEQNEILPQGDEERAWQFQISNETLTARACRKLELIVTSEFDFPELRPVLEGDIDVAVWWVVSQSNLDVSLCPQ